MIAAFIAEWTKIRRLSILAAAFAMIGLSVAGTFLGIARIEHRPDASILIALLGEQNGLASLLHRGASLLLVITLVTIAASTGEEFSHGTVRNLFVANPHRVRLFCGKVAALFAYCLAAAIVALVASSTIAYFLGPGVGITTGNWVTPAGWQALGWFSLDFLACIAGWTILGAFAGILFRSAAAGVGVSVIYLLVIEPLVVFLLPQIGQWLPGELLGDILQGGTQAVSIDAALAWTAVYAVCLAAASMALLRVRDVTS